MARRTLPTRFLSRAAASGRIAASIARRALRGSGDEELGDALFTELDRLKGMAMKVGQILSYLEVGLPDATVARLAALQRGAEPLAFDVVRDQLERQLGLPLDQLFDHVDPAPVAAASIGQVHRAVLRGAEVAVKVRYPGVRETMAGDVRQLHALSRLASLGTSVDGPALVAELAARLDEECDYAREATWQACFGRLLANEPELVVPAVFPERSAEGVLTTAWCDGEPFEALLGADPARRERVGLALARFPWTTLLGHGLLHADPHPGNFLFAGERVVVLDYGCVKQLSVHEVEAFRALVTCVLEDRRSELLERASAVGLVPRPDRIDLDELWALLCWMLDPYRARRFRFTREWWQAGMRRFGGATNPNARWMGFPPSWLWLQRTLLGLHAVLMRLDVELALRPVLEDLLERSLVPEPCAA